MRNARLSLPAGMWYNSSKQSLKHWKNVCRRETPPAESWQRHFLYLNALHLWYDSFKQSLQLFESDLCRFIATIRKDG